jgi:hypothetical protein
MLGRLGILAVGQAHPVRDIAVRVCALFMRSAMLILFF